MYVSLPDDIIFQASNLLKLLNVYCRIYFLCQKQVFAIRIGTHQLYFLSNSKVCTTIHTIIIILLFVHVVNLFNSTYVYNVITNSTSV